MDTSTAGEDWRIPDALWAEMEPLIRRRPNTHRFGGGRPRKPDRQCADAIFFVLRTGCQWKALDATEICPGSTAHDRFQQWVRDGFFLRLWEGGLLEHDALKGIDWSWLSMDGCMTKAPLGGEKDRPQPHRQGQEGHQAEHPRRRARGAGRPGGRGRQPAGLQDGPPDGRVRPGQPARGGRGGAPAAAHLPGQGLRLRRGG
jgi:transposase